MLLSAKHLVDPKPRMREKKAISHFISFPISTFFILSYNRNRPLYHTPRTTHIYQIIVCTIRQWLPLLIGSGPVIFIIIRCIYQCTPSIVYFEKSRLTKTALTCDHLLYYKKPIRLHITIR